MPKILISDNDWRVIRDLIKWWRGSRVTHTKKYTEKHKFQSPDIYVALPPEGGISAASELIAGVPGAGDTPGSAICDIYKINDVDALEAYTGLDKTVYNITLDAIAQQWIIVVRSKQGRWLAISPAGSGAANYKVTTFPLWEESSREFFVRAIPTPSDEDSDSLLLETSDLIAGTATGDVQIYLTGLIVTQDSFSLSNVINSIHPGLRVWATAANDRLELVSFPTPDDEWFRFSKGSDDYPPHSAGVIQNGLDYRFLDAAEGTGSGILGKLLAATTKQLANLPIITGPWGLGTDPAAGTGNNFQEYANATIGTFALAKPVLARINQDTLPAGGYPFALIGQSYGIIPGGTELYPGIPGFVVLPNNLAGPPGDVTENLSDGGLAVLVLGVPGLQVCYAKANADWVDTNANHDMPYVICNPVISIDSTGGVVTGQFPYDGSATTPDGLGTMPDVEIVVWLPKNGTERDPNIRTGNIIMYRQAGTNLDMPSSIHKPGQGGNLSSFIIAGGYLDDKIGTIKLWNLTTAAIPQGWRVWTGFVNNDFLRLNTTTTGGGGNFGAAGAAHGFVEVIPIERFQ